MKARILTFLCLALALSAVGCGKEPAYVTDRSVSVESLKGKWEGVESNGKVKAYVTFEDEFIQIEYINELNSKTRDSYRVTAIGGEMVLTIENMMEPLWVAVNGNQLRFELSPEDSRKVSVPTITMLTFRKIQEIKL